MLGRLLAILFFAGSLTGLCFAQTDNPAGGANSTSVATPSANSGSAAPTPKKVWTNDDVPSAKPAVLPPAKRNTNQRAASTQTGDPATVQRIRKSLEKLQAQIEDIDKTLKTYKEFLEGETVSAGAREMNKGVNRVPVDQQMAQLQDKRKQLEAQMSELYDEARKKGIDPGELR